MNARNLAVVIGVFVAGYGLYQIDEPWLTFATGGLVALLAFGAGLPSKSKSDEGASDG